MTREYTALFPFGGSGGGALGFMHAEARLLERIARFRILGSLDFDASACRDFERFTGAPAWHVDVEDVQPSELIRRYGARAPDVVFMSPPCKGSSRLLGTAKASLEKYQAMNRLALVWTRVMLAAWGEAPPSLLLLENVPGLPQRAGKMLAELRAMLKRAGYVFHASTHDCGEIGGLAQHRERYLLVARHVRSCSALLYKPVKKRVRGVGEVLGELPMPATVAASAWGDLHTMPRIQWRNWLRLALIPAGGDWRDLEGVLAGRERREVFRRHPVQSWGEPIDAVTGPGGHSIGAVSDPRVALPEGTAWHHDALGVRSWQQPSGTVTGKGTNPTCGRFTVADVRVPVGYDAAYGVLGWDQPARTVAGNTAAGCGAYAVADPRERTLVQDVRVLTIDEAMALDLDPTKPPPFTPLIIAADGTWHRPLTPLELAALQGYPTQIDGKPVVWDGGRTLIAEHIGNSVPPPAARAVAEQMLVTMLAHEAGEMVFGQGGFWVSPEKEMHA